MKRILMMMMAVALMALPAKAQIGQQQQNNPFGAVAPAAGFQSTSSMSGSGSTYSSNPTLNANGTANAPAYAPGGPRRLPGTQQEDEESGELPEGAQTNPTDPNPVGDAILPLLLFAAAFAGVVYVRRRKAQA